MLPSVIALGTVALMAIYLTISRPLSDHTSTRKAAARALAVALAMQGAHFAEEAFTGFPTRFPETFGQAAMPLAVFWTVNLVWLAVWVVSIPALRSGWLGAVFAAWFLAIAGTLNGVAHPLLAGMAGGYFPGLMTSPAIGVAGGFLLIRMRAATRGP